MKIFPRWLRCNLYSDSETYNTKRVLEDLGINTVCDSARCPNKSECFSKGRATFLILGNTCTRNCNFCSVAKGKPNIPDEDEGYRIMQAVKELKMEYVVITSVTRDDLSDGGSKYFCKAINILKALSVFLNKL